MKNKKANAAIWTLVGILTVVGIIWTVDKFGGFDQFTSIPGEESVGVCAVDTDCDQYGTGYKCISSKCVRPEVQGNRFASYYLSFDIEAIDSAAQDAESDIEIDIFKVTDEGLQDLADDNIIDCLKSKAKPSVAPTEVIVDGSTAKYTIKESNKCQINYYKFFKDSSYNGADEETKIDDSLKRHLVDEDNNATPKMTALEKYLIVITESASTDVWDAEPTAFLLTSGDKTTFDVQSVQNGDVKFEIEYTYPAAAIPEGKFDIEGECDDSEGNDGYSLGSALDSALHSSVTDTQTNVNIECEVELTIQKDGYAFYFENPLATGDSEKPYIVAYPYVGGYNTSGLGCQWSEITAPLATSPLKYSATPAAAGNYTFIESVEVEGKTITDSSGSDANVNIAEKLYDLPFMKNVEGDGESISISVKFTNIANVNYATTAAGSSTSLYCANETISNGDALLNLTLIGLASTTDAIQPTITA